MLSDKREELYTEWLIATTTPESPLIAAQGQCGHHARRGVVRPRRVMVPAQSQHQEAADHNIGKARRG